MSLVQAKLVIEKMKTDVEFKENVLSIESAEGRIAYINEQGLLCSLMEIAEMNDQITYEEIGQSSGNYCKMNVLC